LAAAVILALVLSACGTSDSTSTSNNTGGTTGGQTEQVLKVLNPQGVYIPVDCKPNAPRLDTLAGKTILYYESEATNMHMPTLLEWLKDDYPTTTFDVIHVENFGARTPTDEQKEKYDAVIRGVGW
jgi:hypothetical protein